MLLGSAFPVSPRHQITAVFVAIVLLAGCANEPDTLQGVQQLGGDEERVISMTAIEERIGRAIVPPFGNASAQDWFVMPAKSGPNGSLAGFQWTVPAGAIIPLDYCCTGVILEVAPIVVGDAQIQEWCLFVFRDLAGEMVSIDNRYGNPKIVESDAGAAGSSGTGWGAYCRHPVHKQTIDYVAGATQDETVPMPVSPLYIVLTDATIAELTDLFFVVAAKSSNTTEFGLAFRPLTEFPRDYDRRVPSPNSPAATLDEFLLRVGTDQPLSAQPLGTGSGLHLFKWHTTMGLQAYGHVTVPPQSPDLAVATISTTTSNESTPRPVIDQRAVGAVWDFNVTSEYGSKGGWDFVLVSYLAACSHGLYSWSLDAHGPASTHKGIVANDAGCGAIAGGLATYLAFGNSGLFIARGGNGTTGRAHFELQTATAVWDELQIQHVSLGTRLEDLLLRPAGETLYWSNGLANDVAPNAST